ncbi:hypothetical protein JRO89_XS03G0155100 [Xanthoceras sorbifolium]|uniref:Integrase zinc-binding domain-containing protein n=1 Tax=Xanthoceras sorbifolium TaxID=99658 RepID=A0ABQ8I9Z6_9ROSI|nr:hypothetical protein JRO89_XS03G0155100 [Xanthoceras sorbifolium]
MTLYSEETRYAYPIILKIIKKHHKEGHMGHDKTLQLMENSYFWPTLRQDVYRCFSVHESPPVLDPKLPQLRKRLIGGPNDLGMVSKGKRKASPERRDNSDDDLDVANSRASFLHHGGNVGDHYNKLSTRKISPLEINSNAYRLKLPSHIRTLDVFNVKHLVPYKGDNSDEDLDVANSRVNFLHHGWNDGDHVNSIALDFMER